MARKSQPQTPTGWGERLRFIEGMRGVAALYVVLSHFCSMVDPGAFVGKSKAAYPWVTWLMLPFTQGHLAVAAFIVISGFCLQMAMFNNGSGRITSLGRFFSRRALRILPPYYACLALSILAGIYVTPLGQGMPFKQYLPVTTDNVLAHVFLIHNFNPEWIYKLNGVLWSIAVEVQLYLLFPALVWVLLKGGRVALLTLTSMATAAIFYGIPEAHKLYPWFLALFAIGMVGAHAAYRPNVKFGPVPTLGFASALASIGLVIWGSSARLSAPVLDLGIGLFSASVMYLGAVRPGARTARLFAWKPLVWLGAISYSLYLMHHPLQQALYIFRPAGVAGVEAELGYLMLVGLPAILLGCTIFWWAFERPFVISRQYQSVDEGGLTPVSLPLLTFCQNSGQDIDPSANHSAEIARRAAPVEEVIDAEDASAAITLH